MFFSSRNKSTVRAANSARAAELFGCMTTPPDPIAYYRAAQGFLDAEAESALRQFVGAEENSEVGTRTALSGAVDSIKFSAPHQPRFARIQIPVRA